ncbi:MAG: hypothetical protein OEW87_08465, partial [Flavobacteriaceae bacterium]|nr:hypothetical protein [Flavobacteriaceae bacterium]
KKNKIILIINDDFISTFGKIFKNYAGSIQKETCQISNRILTVSTYLQRQLGDDCKPELFLPWSNSTYKKPIGGVKRDTLLLWGYINQKIDFNLINNMAKQLGKADKNLRILIVGPVHRVEQEMDHLCKGYANVETLPATSLNELPIDRCFGAIIPYKSGIPWNDAIMLPNKALHLLSRGMPLLISGMPEFIKAQFIFRIDTDSTVGTVLEIRDKFSQFQSDIESFVKCNSAKKRLEQFMNIT